MYEKKKIASFIMRLIVKNFFFFYIQLLWFRVVLSGKFPNQIYNVHKISIQTNRKYESRWVPEEFSRMRWVKLRTEYELNAPAFAAARRRRRRGDPKPAVLHCVRASFRFPRRRALFHGRSPRGEWNRTSKTVSRNLIESIYMVYV